MELFYLTHYLLAIAKLDDFSKLDHAVRKGKKHYKHQFILEIITDDVEMEGIQTITGRPKNVMRACK